MKLPINRVLEDPEVQLREHLDMDRVIAMVEFEEQGGQLPPITVVGTANLLGDGHHRLAAARRSGKQEIDANRIDGGKPEAVAAAISGNDLSTHAPLNRTQRNQGVKMLLEAGWTQQQIAKTTGVHQTTIMDIHNALAMRGQITKNTEPSRGAAGGRVPKPVTVLPRAVHEKLNDTILTRIADQVPLEKQGEFATAVARVDLPDPRVREAIKAMQKDKNLSPEAAVFNVTPQVRIVPPTLYDVAKQVRRRLDHFLEETMTVQSVERDFWAVLDVLAANSDGIEPTLRDLATRLADISVRADYYGSKINTAINATEEVEALA